MGVFFQGMAMISGGLPQAEKVACTVENLPHAEKVAYIPERPTQAKEAFHWPTGRHPLQWPKWRHQELPPEADWI